MSPAEGSREEIQALLVRPEFPRSRATTPWMLDNQMGPNAVWLVEWLCERSRSRPESGCSTSAAVGR